MPGSTGFAVQRRRRLIDRSFTWLGRYRRLAKDHERKVQTAGAIACVERRGSCGVETVGVSGTRLWALIVKCVSVPGRTHDDAVRTLIRKALYCTLRSVLLRSITKALTNAAGIERNGARWNGSTSRSRGANAPPRSP